METVRSENLPLNEVMRPTEARLSDTISSSTISQQHHQGQYEPYGIIGQGVLPLNIPFSLLQYAQYQDSAKVKDTLRRGKWTDEEVRLTDKIIETFNAGSLELDVSETQGGVTLRSYLSEKLGCDPMRITKKYTGASCLGKRVYHSGKTKVSREKVEAVKKELVILEFKFREKLEKNCQDRMGLEADVDNHLRNQVMSRMSANDKMMHESQGNMGYWGYSPHNPHQAHNPHPNPHQIINGLYDPPSRGGQNLLGLNPGLNNKRVNPDPASLGVNNGGSPRSYGQYPSPNYGSHTDPNQNPNPNHPLYSQHPNSNPNSNPKEDEYSLGNYSIQMPPRAPRLVSSEISNPNPNLESNGDINSVSDGLDSPSSNSSPRGIKVGVAYSTMMLLDTKVLNPNPNNDQYDPISGLRRDSNSIPNLNPNAKPNSNPNFNPNYPSYPRQMAPTNYPLNSNFNPNLNPNLHPHLNNYLIETKVESKASILKKQKLQQKSQIYHIQQQLQHENQHYQNQQHSQNQQQHPNQQQNYQNHNQKYYLSPKDCLYPIHPDHINHPNFTNHPNNISGKKRLQNCNNPQKESKKSKGHSSDLDFMVTRPSSSSFDSSGSSSRGVASELDSDSSLNTSSSSTRNFNENQSQFHNPNYSAHSVSNSVSFDNLYEREGETGRERESGQLKVGDTSADADFLIGFFSHCHKVESQRDVTTEDVEPAVELKVGAVGSLGEAVVGSEVRGDEIIGNEVKVEKIENEIETERGTKTESERESATESEREMDLWVESHCDKINSQKELTRREELAAIESQREERESAIKSERETEIKVERVMEIESQINVERESEIELEVESVSVTVG